MICLIQTPVTECCGLVCGFNGIGYIEVLMI
jgi:hypothetical protein